MTSPPSSGRTTTPASPSSGCRSVASSDSSETALDAVVNPLPAMTLTMTPEFAGLPTSRQTNQAVGGLTFFRPTRASILPIPTRWRPREGFSEGQGNAYGSVVFGAIEYVSDSNQDSRGRPCLPCFGRRPCVGLASRVGSP
jgi:hypothetical protein